MVQKNQQSLMFISPYPDIVALNSHLTSIKFVAQYSKKSTGVKTNAFQNPCSK